MAEVIVVANQKGGVGKTTTVINLGAALAQLGFETLLIDIDPQCNTTSGLGFDKRIRAKSVYDCLLEEEAIEKTIRQTPIKLLDLVPSSPELVGAEVQLATTFARENKLRNAVADIEKPYRFILIDCPPSLGLLTINALNSSSKVIIPVQCEYYALEGLASFISTIEKVKSALNPHMDIDGGILTMFDQRISLASQVRIEMEKFFKEKLYKTTIPRNIRLAEAPGFGQSIFQYDPKSRGAEAYLDLAKEFLARRGISLEPPEAPGAQIPEFSLS